MNTRIIISHLLFILFSIEFVNGKSAAKYFEEHDGAHLGFNVSAGVTIVSIFLGTPIFFIVNFFVCRYEDRKREEMELEEIKSKSFNRRKFQTENKCISNVNNGAGTGRELERKSSDYYGTNKIIRDCITRHNSISQIFVNTSQSSPTQSSPSQSSINGNSGQVGNSTSINIANISPLTQSQNSLNSPATANNNGNNPSVGVLKSNSIGYLPPIASYNSSNSGGGGSANNSPRRFNERLITPPSPILSTFGGRRDERDVPSPRPSLDDHSYPYSNNSHNTSNSNLKRTISADSGKQIRIGPQFQHALPLPAVPPLPANIHRPKSMNGNGNEKDNCRIGGGNKNSSGNATLLNLLSSNTVPKDHWHCIVYRVQELAMSYWSPPKYDVQAPLTAVTQIELSLQGFSEQEQFKKGVITIDDQKYFSPIIFELYSKLLPLHEFIRSKPSKSVEKDINGVFGVFLIILPSLFNSYINWTNEISEGCRRKLLTSSQEHLIDCLSSNDILERSFIHKVSIHYLTQYIRHLLFYASKGYNGSTLYKIVDLYHGIADDIDKLLFDNESYEDFEELQKVTNTTSSISSLSSSTNNLGNDGGSDNPFRIDIQQNQDCSLLNIVTSIANRFSHIDNYLEQIPQEHPPINGSLLTLQQQKSIISSCYNHLQTSLSILSATEIFSAKFKVDTIPILKMMLVSLNTLEEQLDAGVSIGEMDSGELLEWTNNYTRIATTLNNAILKNSSILMASQIVDGINNSGNNNNHNYPGPTSTTLTMESPNISSTSYSPSPSPSSNSTTNNHLIRKNAKIKPPSSPFGSPAIMSFLMNEGIGNDMIAIDLELGGGGEGGGGGGGGGGGMNGADNNHHQMIYDSFPSTRERCAQIVQLSQDSIMLTVMSSFSMSSRTLRSSSSTSSSSSSPSTNNDTSKPQQQQLPPLPPAAVSKLSASISKQHQQQQQFNQVADFFNDGVGVFFSSIRTNIFCTYILLNPIYLNS